MPKTKRKRIKSRPERDREIDALYSKPARRKGDEYCAPWCGRGCTWAEHQLAKRRAKVLAKHMGKGWKIRVWENMGWHYEVLSPCGRINLSEHWRHEPEDASTVDRLAVLVPEDYTAYLNTAGRGGGRWTGSGSTPEEAIRNAVEAGMNELEVVRSIVEGLESWAA